MRGFLIAGLILASVSSVVFATPQPPPVIAPVAETSASKPTTPEAKAAALRLARLLQTEEAQVAMAERMTDRDLRAAFANDKNMQIIESEHPGFLDAVLKELKPIVVRFTRRELPEYHARIADLLSTRFDAAEMDDLAKFYQTPTGQKLIRGMQENATIGSTLEEIVADPDRPTSFSAVNTDHKASVVATVKTIDESDHAALREFASKPYFDRMAAFGASMRKLEQEIANEPQPAFEAEIGAVMNATLAEFEAAKK